MDIPPFLLNTEVIPTSIGSVYSLYNHYAASAFVVFFTLSACLAEVMLEQLSTLAVLAHLPVIKEDEVLTSVNICIKLHRWPLKRLW